jgi:2-isopropylmalate synthase
MPKEVYEIFLRDFVNVQDKLRIINAEYMDVSPEVMRAEVEIELYGLYKKIVTEGNGRLNCISTAIKQATGREYVLENYVEHALEGNSTSEAASYVCIVSDGKAYWGTGIHTDIMTSSVLALVSAVNRML